MIYLLFIIGIICFTFGFLIAKINKPFLSISDLRFPSRISLFQVHGWGLTRTVLENDMNYVLNRFGDKRLHPTVMCAIDLAYAMGREENK